MLKGIFCSFTHLRGTRDSTFVNVYCQASMNLAGNDPEPLGLAFHHQGSTFINEKKSCYKDGDRDWVNRFTLLMINDLD